MALSFLAAAAGGVLYYGASGRDAQIFAASVARGPGIRRSVALTFDDGPAPGSLEILRVLAGEGVRATFFQCGANVVRYPDIARAIAGAGHAIGNHTFTHRRLCPRLGWRPNLLSARTVYQEFAWAQDVIARETGTAPRFMRAPYGLRWRGMRRAQWELGLLDVAWTAIGHDWEWSGTRVARHLESKAEPGAILCLHDGRDTRPAPDITTTVDSLKRLIPGLRARGFTFETVDEILC